MKIEIYNDGKNGFQSWEAKAILNHEIDNAHSLLSLEAYGATEEEARKNLGAMIRSLCDDLTQIQNNNQNETKFPTI